MSGNNLTVQVSINDGLADVLENIYDKMSDIADMCYGITQNINNNLNIMTKTSTKIKVVNVNLSKVTNSYSEINQEQITFNENIDHAVKKTDGLLDKFNKVSTSIIDIPDPGELLSKAVSYSDNLTRMKGNVSGMNDGSQSDQQLQDKIYGASIRSRTDIGSNVNTVKGLGDAGFNNDEAIQYTENLNKMFAIAGTGQEAQASATDSMISSLADGVVTGEELNNMFNTTPEIISAMAENMGMPVNEMMELAEQGKLTSDILKNSMLGATDSINAKFGGVKSTWSDTMTNIENIASIAFEPLGDKINEVINSPSMGIFISTIASGMTLAANLITGVIEILMPIGGFILDNLGIIAPILLFIIGLYALWKIRSIELITFQDILATSIGFVTSVSKALSDIWKANPVVIIIMAIIAALYIVIAIINKVCGTSYSATGIIAGVIMTAIAVVWNAVLSIADYILAIIGFFINRFIIFANFFSNVFKNPISSIIYLFRDMAVNVLKVIKSIAGAMDKVFGTDMAGTVDGWIGGVNDLADKAVSKFAKDENYEQKFEEFNLTTESLGLERMDYGESYNKGYEFGDGLTEFSLSDMGGGLGNLPGGDYSSIANLPGDYSSTGVEGPVQSAGGLAIGDNSEIIQNLGSNNKIMEGIDTNTAEGNTNTYNTASNTQISNEKSEELAEIGKSIITIMKENAEYERSKKPVQNITIDMSGMNNNISSNADGKTLISIFTDEMIKKINTSPEGAYA